MPSRQCHSPGSWQGTVAVADGACLPVHMPALALSVGLYEKSGLGQPGGLELCQSMQVGEMPGQSSGVGMGLR